MNLFSFDVEHLVDVAIDVRARGTARGRIAAHQMELAVEYVAREPVPGKGHIRQHRPGVGSGVVRLDCTERSLPRAIRALLAACSVDLALERARRPRASRVDHRSLQRSPLVGRRIVLFHYAGVARTGDESRTQAPADYVNLVAHDAD